MKRYVQVYTGNGKGKTTAAFGHALRSAGAGLKVYIGQFMKNMRYHEIVQLESANIPNITTVQYGKCCQEGLEDIRKVLASKEYDVVIMDEAVVATYFNYFTTAELVDIMKNKPDEVELILTGRYATEDIIEAADLVTEMKEVKHYYTTQGVEARDGFER